MHAIRQFGRGRLVGFSFFLQIVQLSVGQRPYLLYSSSDDRTFHFSLEKALKVHSPPGSVLAMTSISLICHTGIFLVLLMSFSTLLAQVNFSFLIVVYIFLTCHFCNL